MLIIGGAWEGERDFLVLWWKRIVVVFLLCIVMFAVVVAIVVAWMLSLVSCLSSDLLV